MILQPFVLYFRSFFPAAFAQLTVQQRVGMDGTAGVEQMVVLHIILEWNHTEPIRIQLDGEVVADAKPVLENGFQHDSWYVYARRR